MLYINVVSSHTVMRASDLNLTVLHARSGKASGELEKVLIPADRMPVRQVSRLITELHLNGVQNINRLSDRHYDRGIVLMVVARHCLPDWIDGSSLRPPATLTRFTSINSTASSLGRPFETIRRYVRGLIADGLCVEDRRGYALAVTPDAASRLVRYFTSTHDVLVRFVAELHALRLIPTLQSTASTPLMGNILVAALDVQLLPFESLREPLADWTTMLIWGAIGAACVRHVTTDVEASERYAVLSTPNNERRPISLPAVAALTELPYATVWRHVQTMALAGQLVKKDRGWIVGTSHLRSDEMEPTVVAAVASYQRRAEALIQLGMNPSDAGALYLSGRPELVPLP